MGNPASSFDHVTALVCDSALRQFERLNPDNSSGSGPLPVYDWEIAADTGIALEAVQESLRNLDGSWVVLDAINGELRVVGTTAPSPG